MPRTMRYSRPKSDPPESILQFLLRRFPYLSVSQWEEHIEAGHLSLNKSVCQIRDRVLEQGDEVLFQPPRMLEPRVDETHIEVLVEDDTVLVCAKNGELPVTEGGRYCENTLTGVLVRSGTASFLRQSGLDGENVGGQPGHARCRPAKRAREKSISQDPPEQSTGLEERDAPPSFFPVHRLDKETSGLLVMGKTLTAAQALSHQFESQSLALLDALAPLLAKAPFTSSMDTAWHAQFDLLLNAHKRIIKTYRAVVAGSAPVGSVKVVTENIGKLSEDPQFASHPDHQKLKKLKMACFPPSHLQPPNVPVRGKPAVSRITWLRTDSATQLSVVEVNLLTGRTHQIRLHCAHLGFPIVGDKLYSSREMAHEGGSLAVEDDVYMDRARRGEWEMLPSAHHPTLFCKRHLLHATTLSFQHPVSGHAVEVVSPCEPWFLRDIRADEVSLQNSVRRLLAGL